MREKKSGGSTLVTLLIAVVLAYVLIVHNQESKNAVNGLFGPTDRNASGSTGSASTGFSLSDFFKGVSLPRSTGGTHLSPASGSSVVGGPSISAQTVNRVLSAAGSPAAGTGDALYSLSQRYGIDDAYALAVFQHESSYGTAGVARETHALGNIICAGYPTCIGRFRSYGSWEEGYADFYRLIKNTYAPEGRTTVESITPKYAPSNDGNDPVGYEQSVRASMDAYRRMG